MKYLRTIIASGVIVAGIVAFQSPVQAAEKCDVNPAVAGVSATDLTNKSIVQRGNRVDVSVTVTGPADCKKTVSVASWKWYTKFGLPLESQKLYKTNTATFGIGTHKLSVEVPECSWQVDLVEGSRPTAADGTANYKIGEPNDKTDRLMDAAFGGNGICTDSKPFTTDPVQQIKTLPNTGAANLIGSTIALSTAAGAAYSFMQKRKY